MTTAVDDIAPAMPATRAAGGGMPASTASPASTAVLATTCSAPRPNTRRRITQSRSTDSSRPIMNISMTTPSSATGAIEAGSPKVTAPSQGSAATARPSPKGPTAMPTSM